jgi:hypothetical protein
MLTAAAVHAVAQRRLIAAVHAVAQRRLPAAAAHTVAQRRLPAAAEYAVAQCRLTAAAAHTDAQRTLPAALHTYRLFFLPPTVHDPTTSALILQSESCVESCGLAIVERLKVS